MGKAEFGTPKWISNNIKSKGLQKLRWFCQMCQKQCRDENGFKCHTTSEAHQRQLLLFAEKPGKFLDSFSREFEANFMSILKRCHGTKRVFANAVYQEYIRDKEHVHMNATKWVTLTGFVKYLGSSGKCVVDETEKGWYITWIDRDPETIARQEALKKKEKVAKDDEERMADFIAKQVERQRERMGDQVDDEPEYTELQRKGDDEKIQLGLKLSSASSASTNKTLTSTKGVFKVPKLSESASKKESGGGEDSKKRKSSALEEIMKEEEDHKKKKLAEAEEAAKAKSSSSEKPWLKKGIVVKIVTKSLGDKYYKQKAYVKELADKYTAIVVVISSGAKVKMDQSHLETVIPAVGRDVLVLVGENRGQLAELKSLDVEKFSAKLEIVTGPNNGQTIRLPYEHFSKLHNPDDKKK